MRRQSPQAALAALLLLVGLAGCQKFFSPSSEGVGVVGRLAGEQEPADVVLRRLAFVRLADGRVAARGTAAEASYRQSASTVEAMSLSVELPPGSHAPADVGHLRITAPQASGDLTARTGLGWGGVDARAERGDHATTERVLIDGPGNRVTSPTLVDAAGPGYAVHGSSLTATADGRSIRLQGGVQGRLTPAPQAPHSPPPAVKKPARKRRKAP